VPGKVTSTIKMPPVVSPDAPEFVQTVTAEIMAMRGDSLPVSKMPVDGRFPTGTTQFEKRNIAVNIPIWQPELCLQCGMCSLVCPHATIRIKAYDPKELAGAPEAFKSIDAKGKEFQGMKFTVQVAPEDCTGCGACVVTCPGAERDANKQPTGRKAINMEMQEQIRERERSNYEFFLSIPKRTPRGSRAVWAASQLNLLVPASGAVRRLVKRLSLFAIAPTSTRPAARRSTAATCRRRPTRRVKTAAARLGATASSRTTPNSRWA
jgi:ferredoxin